MPGKTTRLEIRKLIIQKHLDGFSSHAASQISSSQISSSHPLSSQTCKPQLSSINCIQNHFGFLIKLVIQKPRRALDGQE